MIDIKSKDGKTIYSTPINEGAVRKFTLMKEDYVIIPFSVDNPINFKQGCRIDNEFGLFEVVDITKPTYNSNTGGYDYKLRLDAHYWKWKNKIFKYTPENTGQEASWNLTATLDVQASIVLRNLKVLGYTYKGKEFTFSIDSSVENKLMLMSYDNINILDACFAMAKKWDCECWITENIIHFGKLEFGSPVNFEMGNNVEEMSRSDSKDTFATRIYAFGSTKNIPQNYRKSESDFVVNGVVQKRLMLPVDTPYIDAYPNMTTEEAVEQIIVFDDIYPKTECVVGKVDSYSSTIKDKTTENPDDTITETFYYVTDTSGFVFKKDYILKEGELKVQFQSGKLNGLEFGCVFRTKGEILDGKKLGSDVYEIVANEDYGRKLPDSILLPEAGDKFILIGWDSTKLDTTNLISTAENELKKSAKSKVEKMKIDPSTYTCKMMSDSIYSPEGVHNLYGAGQKVNLINKAYFDNGRVSRIIGFEYKLDYPYDTPSYVVGETVAYSRIGELEDKIENITLNGQTYTGGNGSGVYVIGRYDNTPFTDRNVLSSLRSKGMFVSKNEDDIVHGLIKFLGGLDFDKMMRSVGAIDSMAAGKGIVMDAERGLVQADRFEARHSMTVMELIINRLSAMEGDYSFSDGGTVDRLERQADGTYRLWLRKRWEHDFTALHINDIVYGMINTLAAGGTDYHTSWMRVLHVDTAANAIDVTLYPDTEVPGGKNYPPSELMVITRRGNPVDPERQGYWYLSSSEHCICMLDGVTKPILEEANYSVIVGRLKHLSIFDNLPINYRQSYVYCRGIATQDMMQIDYEGTPVRSENNRGKWSVAEATNRPYESSLSSYDAVYHYGCKWMCLKTGTTQEPRFGCTDWAMIEGNPDFTIDIESSRGWYFDADRLDTTFRVVGELYNRDVTEHILDADITWTRDTGNPTEDNAWAMAHAEAGKELHLTTADLGPDYMNQIACSFTATALLRDGQNERMTSITKNII